MERASGTSTERRFRIGVPRWKRAMDLSIAFCGLVALSPLILVVVAAIRLDSRGPVLYRQTRIGRQGKPFQILKFRTMHSHAHGQRPTLGALNEGAGGLFKIRDDPRITPVGRVLRRFSLDELPQLVNVLRGEMSLVGPRPLIPEEDRLVEGRNRARLDLSPGMTGYWQVERSGRISLDELLELDRRYVREWSPVTDLRVLIRTLRMVASRSGF